MATRPRSSSSSLRSSASSLIGVSFGVVASAEGLQCFGAGGDQLLQAVLGGDELDLARAGSEVELDDVFGYQVADRDAVVDLDPAADGRSGHLFRPPACAYTLDHSLLLS